MQSKLFSFLCCIKKSTKNLHTFMFITFFALIVVGTMKGEEIKKQKLKMNLSNGKRIEKEILLPREISELSVEHIIIAGPNSFSVKSRENNETILIFIKGRGNLLEGDKNYSIIPETIAIPFASQELNIFVPKGDTLHFIQMDKILSEQDVVDIKTYPIENRNKIYFTSFEDCEAYTEKIKSPNTVSRTILPKDYIPRVAMGTVKTKGPDAVGAHKHPMLDQLFLGLAGNKIEVIADDASIQFNEFEILHIPIGSNHSAKVKENETMYYVWMDFFLTKKGEEWLKTHNKINDDSDSYNNPKK